MPLPVVSVIVVARNSEKYLQDAIASILAQTYPHREIILVDGQSTDATATIAKSYSEINYIYQETLGLSNARNLGLKIAQGEFIAFLDSDDRWTSDKLKLQAETLINNAKIDYVTGYLQLIAETNTNLRKGYVNDVLQKPKWGRTPGVLMARRQLFTQVGNFDTKYKIAGDLEWFVRVQKMAIPTLTLPEVLLYKRIRDNSLSTQSEINRREVMQILHQSIKQEKD